MAKGALCLSLIRTLENRSFSLSVTHLKALQIIDLTDQITLEGQAMPPFNRNFYSLKSSNNRIILIRERALVFLDHQPHKTC
jgi:hypothetical protein